MTRLTPIEKLARAICWADLTWRPTDWTEASYWRSLPADTCEEFIQEAERWLWVSKKISPDIIQNARAEL